MQQECKERSCAYANLRFCLQHKFGGNYPYYVRQDVEEIIHRRHVSMANFMHTDEIFI